jgi:hypothetical protein
MKNVREASEAASRNTALTDDPDLLYLKQLRAEGWDIVADDKVKYPDGKDKPHLAPKLFKPDEKAYPDPGLLVPLESLDLDDEYDDEPEPPEESDPYDDE